MKNEGWGKIGIHVYGTLRKWEVHSSRVALLTTGAGMRRIELPTTNGSGTMMGGAMLGGTHQKEKALAALCLAQQLRAYHILAGVN